MRIADSLVKTFGWERLRAGREGDDRGWNSWTGIIYSVDMSLSKFWEKMKAREAWSVAVHGIAELDTI